MDKAIKGSGVQWKELDILLNHQDDKGNTLLHYVALHGQCKDITALIKHDANPLIKNMNNQIPLDLAEGDTKTKLIESMKDQAQLKKQSSICDASKLAFATIFAFAALGVVASMGVVWFSESLAGSVLLGAIIASPFVGIVVGLITYFLDQDRKQAGAISTLLQESEVSEETPLLQPSV